MNLGSGRNLMDHNNFYERCGDNLLFSLQAMFQFCVWVVCKHIWLESPHKTAFTCKSAHLQSIFCVTKSSTFNWDRRSERCASIPKITGSNPSGGSELNFRSDLLLTARGGNTLALIEFACLPCYLGNTLLSAPRAAREGCVGAI
jgi:hypothetical protein